MTRLWNLGNIWKTIKELDVQSIRAEADRQVRVAVIGADELRAPLVALLRRGAEHYRYPGQHNAVDDVLLPLGRHGDLSRADLLVLALPAGRPLSNDEYLAYEKLLVLDAPLLLVVVGGNALPAPAPGMPAPLWSGQRVVYLTDPATELIKLGEAAVELLPQDLHVAAGRLIPGLRPAIAQSLVSETCVTNATYALTSGIPELIPILNLPLAAADMLVLTKNQALMVYRLALTFGAPGDFSEQMQEIMPVIGSGFIWRQLARELVGLIPGFGLLPKTAVAYAGTYAVGIAASRWYARRELVSRSGLRQLMRDGLSRGREVGRELIERVRPQKSPLAGLRRLPSRIRSLLPGGRRADVEQPKEIAE